MLIFEVNHCILMVLLVDPRPVENTDPARATRNPAYTEDNSIRRGYTYLK